MLTPKSFGFPFMVSENGRISATGGDPALRGKIIQVLFTTPGERVNLPEFGCGLFNLVFASNNPILAASMEFTVGQALSRWLGNDLVVNGIDITTQAERVNIEIAYTKRADLARQAVRIQFK